MSIDPRALRDAFGAFLTGVTVVTTQDQDGKPLGFTANSFTSVSLDPPLLLVCLAKTSRNFQPVTSAKRFAINILSDQQKDVSNTFARPVEDRFATVAWKQGPQGSPILEDVAAWFECALHEVIDAGDHAILLGRVEAFENGYLTGLGYARGGYFSPALADRAVLAGHELRQVLGVIAGRERQVLLIESANGLALPSADLASSGETIALEAQLSALTGLATQNGLIFSVYEDLKSRCQHVIYRAELGAGTPGKGALYSIDALPLERISDAATRDVLKRYAAEAGMGNFGIYIGNQERGRIHSQAARG